MSAVPDPVPAGASDLPPAGWTGRERLVIALLVLGLLGLGAARMQTRRPDSARNPTDLDVLVLHVGGLGSNAATLDELANDLDFDPADMQRWSNAFAQSTDAVRSARSALEGDLVRDLGVPAGPQSLPVRLGERGWRTLLVDQDSGALSRTVGQAFDVAASVPDGPAAVGALAAWWAAPDPSPRFAFVHLGFGQEPLHADTTEAYVLQERYRLRVRLIRETLRDVAAAANTDRRGQLVVLLGASGIETGEHPDAPDLPWDAQLRVPFLMGLRWADGLPAAELHAQVQSADLAPTVLDVLDLRSLGEREGDGDPRLGRSLEAHLHGWTHGPVHAQLVFQAVDHVAVRSPEWKLISPIEHPLRPRRAGSRLFALREDPGEARDLLAGAAFGPIAEEQFGVLALRFGEPHDSGVPTGTAQAPPP